VGVEVPARCLRDDRCGTTSRLSGTVPVLIRRRRRSGSGAVSRCGMLYDADPKHKEGRTSLYAEDPPGLRDLTKSGGKKCTFRPRLEILGLREVSRRATSRAPNNNDYARRRADAD